MKVPFIKVIPPGGYNFGEQETQLIKVASRGLRGNDLHAFIKRAGYQFADEVKKLNLKPGDVPAHDIIIGATEYFGCFVAGSEVRMGNSEARNIEDIQVGDIVVDRLGRPAPVITKYARPYVGPGSRINVVGMLDDVTCTSNHKFWAIPQEQVQRSVDAIKYCKPNIAQQILVGDIRNYSQSAVRYEPKWIAAEDLQPDDYLLSPITVATYSISKQTPTWSVTLAEQSEQRCFIWNGFVCRPVRKVEAIELSTTVYNLEVEGDHSYTVNTFAVKNCNRNGDGFKEAACKTYHPTFVKHARCYRMHQNKDPNKSYGYVKLSTYNDAMKRIELISIYNGTKEAADRNGGLIADQEIEKLANNKDFSTSMACVLNPESPVLTSEGYKPIASIAVGDKVYTHTGKWQRVSEVNRRVYTGDVVTIHMIGMPEPLELTADHPMFAKSMSGYKKLKNGQRAVAVMAEEIETGKTAFNWVQAGELKAHDRIAVQPVTGMPDSIAIGDPGFAELLGIYLAEGSLSYNDNVPASVAFTVHVDDWAISGIPKLIKSFWSDVTVSIRPKNNTKVAVSLEVFSTELAKWMNVLVGVGASTKQLPAGIFNSSVECKLSLLGRWLDGDGFCDKKGIHWSSCNLPLILQGRDLLLSLGIAASVYRINHQNCATSGYAGSGPEYTLNVSNLDAFALRNFSQKVFNSSFVHDVKTRRKPGCLYKTGERYCYQIRSVEHRHVVNQQTYNFEVDEDHSYSLFGMISHNCRVPFDFCSSCGNRARNRDEYCLGLDEGGSCKGGGLRNKIASVIDDDENPILHADNREPDFFDKSLVIRGAERIAYAMGLTKAAGSVVGGAALAEAWGVTAPADIDLSGDAAMMYKLACKLASLEAEVHKSGRSRMVFSQSVQPSVDWTDHGAKLGEMLQALTIEKIAMPVEGFLSVVGHRGANSKQLAMAVKEHLPGVYGRLIKCGEAINLIESNPFVPSNKLPPAYVRRWAEKRAADYSLGSKHTEARELLASIRSNGILSSLRTESLVKTASANNPGVEEVAKHYAMYKLAAVYGMMTNQSMEDKESIMRLAILQNYVEEK